jgi:CTP:molybdopterin cytidylyltransferase MocA
MASSIRCGLRAHADDDACVMLTGDQPFVTSADIDRLIDVWECARASAPIVALRAGDTWGVPILFSRRDFAKISSLEGDAGAKRYAAQQPQRLIRVDACDLNAFSDVDTSDDLRRLNELEIPRTRP